MENGRKMNILVLGASGAGKSTLIRAVSGSKAPDIGEESTEKIDVYESDIWPLRFIDTKGFEHRFREQRRTIRQIREYTKAQVSAGESDDAGIDAVWYCVEGTTPRTLAQNIDLMNKAVRGWKKVPVFAVITKSYSAPDIIANVLAVEKAFEKARRVNLQKIIPVVAKEFYIDETVRVEPMGLTELCAATLDCVDTAKLINQENRSRMVIEQKRFTARSVVGTAAATAAVIGAVPISFADSAILVPLETLLTKSILKLYKVDFSGDLVSAIVGSAAITNIAKAAITPLKALPIAGSVINGVVAGGMVFALGEAVIAVSEAISTGKIDPAKIDETVGLIEEKLKESPALGSVVSYLQDNADSLAGKSAREIFGVILKVVLKKKLR